MLIKNIFMTEQTMPQKPKKIAPKSYKYSQFMAFCFGQKKQA